MSPRGDYEAVIGLEIHVQLSTRTKMFCGCALSFGDEPNVHTCPVCLGHPGTLPVANERAVEYALQIALALGCEVAPRSIFHRKNYFYPDLPKGYQISQYDTPLALGGRLGEVRIHRVHLEEDAAKLLHVSESGRIHGSGASLVDFNRGGTPLVEIVTEPDLRDPGQAREWAQLLRATVQQLGVSDVNMEEGSLRCDANVSLRPPSSEELGTKTELKNMNSFRFLERGIEAELERQAEVLDRGETVVQETIHFDPRAGTLTPMRSKEYAHDYRYLPEPDLVPLAPTEEMLAGGARGAPGAAGGRVVSATSSELGLDQKRRDAARLRRSELAAYFERAFAAGDGTAARAIANWVTGELVARLREAGEGEEDPEESRVEPACARGPGRDGGVQAGEHGGGPPGARRRWSPRAAIRPRSSSGRGLAQISDAGELEAIVERAIEADPAAAERVRAGNEKAIGPIVGAVMRETKGRADGGEVTRLIHDKLGERLSAVAWNVVIAGGGFTGAYAARELERVLPSQAARVVLVNDVNFLLYTPFLPEAAAGTLEPRHVVTPLRDILRRTDLRLGAISAHDPEARSVELRSHQGAVETLRYDQLLVAVGSVSRLLPVPGLGEHAVGFKSLADAIWLRNHLIETLETANASEDPRRRDELLTYVFVGGGYAGVEALAELQDLAVDAIERYPRARHHGMRWILVEAGDRVLPEIDRSLAEYTLRELSGRGIDVRLGTSLKGVEADSVTLTTGEAIPTRTVVWTAGVVPAPSLRRLALPLDERGRVVVDEYMRVRGLRGVWAAGDCAAVPDPSRADGRACPPTAQHAVREGPLVARNIAAELGVGSARPFEYRASAAFVNLGRHKAVGALGRRRFRGFPAWWMARTYHMSRIPGLARKVRAVMDWTVGLPFGRDVAEVGSIGHPKPLREEEYELGGSHRPV